MRYLCNVVLMATSSLKIISICCKLSLNVGLHSQCKSGTVFVYKINLQKSKFSHFFPRNKAMQLCARYVFSYTRLMYYMCEHDYFYVFLSFFSVLNLQNVMVTLITLTGHFIRLKLEYFQLWR